MKHRFTHIALNSALLTAAAISMAGSIAAPVMAIESARPGDRITIPMGTIIPFTLNNSLSSKNSSRGDKFTATVQSGRDDSGFPSGTRIEGVVQEAQPSIDGKPGMLDIDLRRFVFPNGGTMAVQASLYSLHGKDVKRSDGRLVASSDNSKDRLKWVGIGAGAGLLIGAITKQNELLSGLLGSGAGFLYNELSKKKAGDVTLNEGTPFGVRLDRDIAFNDDRNNPSEGAYIVRTDNGNNNNQNNNNGNNRRRYNDNQNNNPNNGRNYNNGNGNQVNYSGNYRNTYNGNIGMTVDGRDAQFDNNKTPYVRNGVVFVPLVAAGRTGMFDYRYVSSDHSIYARNNSIHVALGSRYATVNGRQRELPAAPEMYKNSIYVPMQLVGWAVGGSTSWDADNKMVVVTSSRNQ
ncbi:MAG: stalk domain-containing protein [Chthonomonadales bacterium]